MTLGEIIKKYRTENKVSMEYVAKQCGITKGYVAMLEKNVNSKTGRPVKPTVETIAKVSKGLHLDIDTVFDMLDDDYEIKISNFKFNESDYNESVSELKKKIEHLEGIMSMLPESYQDEIIRYAEYLSDKYAMEEDATL